MNSNLLSLSKFSIAMRLKAARDASAMRFMLARPDMFQQHIPTEVWNFYRSFTKTYPIPQ